MMGESGFTLQLFNCWELRFRGESLAVPLREQRVLAAMAIMGPVSRRHVSGILWPDSPEARASESLRVSLHHIGRKFPDLVSIDRKNLCLADGVDVDLCRVRAAVARIHGSEPGSYLVETMVVLDCRELLPGWTDEWVQNEKAHLRPLRIAALELLGAEFLRREDYAHAVGALSAVLELEPYLESAESLLVHAHMAAGNMAVAVWTLKGFAERLAADLGVQPSAALQNLIQRTTRA